MKNLILLGASGSIGQSTLDIIENNTQDFTLIAFSVGRQSAKIETILHKFTTVQAIYLIDEIEARQFAKRFPQIVFYSGENGLQQLVSNTPADMVINALVGFVGLAPTVSALTSGKDVALANKETLVVGGELINELLASTGQKLYPIDSEHVALAKCLKGENMDQVKRLVLTASGGAFRHLSREQLKDVTVQEALKHPSWSMGKKITIDSATMMNKGFEIIEAHYLFGFPSEKIDILMHDQSIVHSLVEFVDGSYLADLGVADMRVPITYALYEGKRVETKTNLSLNIGKVGNLTFHEFEEQRYPAVEFARQALKIKGTYPTVLNAANEIAVNAFLEGKIKFLQIEEVIALMLNQHQVITKPDLETLIETDRLIHQQTTALIESWN